MIDEIIELFDAFVADARKAEKGYGTPGRRARKVSLEIDKKLKEFRKVSMGWATTPKERSK